MPGLLTWGQRAWWDAVSSRVNFQTFRQPWWQLEPPHHELCQQMINPLVCIVSPWRKQSDGDIHLNLALRVWRHLSTPSGSMLNYLHPFINNSGVRGCQTWLQTFKQRRITFGTFEVIRSNVQKWVWSQVERRNPRILRIRFCTPLDLDQERRPGILLTWITTSAPIQWAAQLSFYTFSWYIWFMMHFLIYWNIPVNLFFFSYFCWPGVPSMLPLKCANITE